MAGDLTKIWNVGETEKDWEKEFEEGRWEPDTLNLTNFEEELIEELTTDCLPRHMPLYDFNLPFAELIILIIRRQIKKQMSEDLNRMRETI